MFAKLLKKIAFNPTLENVASTISTLSEDFEARIEQEKSEFNFGEIYVVVGGYQGGLVAMARVDGELSKRGFVVQQDHLNAVLTARFEPTNPLMNNSVFQIRFISERNRESYKIRENLALA